jgi:serine/threonine-protein kinase
VELPQQPRVIAGRYALDTLIGEGGMASVYRAKDLTLERPVAVKLLFARDERDKQRLVQQFLREARIAASVHHRNVINIVDFGSIDGEQPYMVMELLEGETLGQRLRREPRLSVTEVVQVAVLTLRGLTAVHDAGIIHRDLKPDNVFLTRDGTGGIFPKILDFGISRSIEPRSGRRSALTTREGMIVGTPEYMSPEQARGVRAIDRRCDIYSMGAIMYEALSGRLPFANENVGDLIIQIVTGSLEKLDERCPEVPAPIAEVVHRAMARLPEHRYQDAGEMQAALADAAARCLPNMPVTLSESPPAGPAHSMRMSMERVRTLEFRLDGEASAEELAAFLPSRSDGDIPTLPRPPRLPELEGDPRRTTLPRALALTAIISLAIGGGAALLLRERSDEAGRLAAAATANAAQAEPTSAAEPPEPVGPIKVELRGVPKNAQVSVDGVPAAGNVLELARDRRNRVIRVTAPDKTPWQAVLHASSDATYDVMLADVPTGARAPAAQPASRPARPKARATTRAPSALRQLDF